MTDEKIRSIFEGYSDRLRHHWPEPLTPEQAASKKGVYAPPIGRHLRWMCQQIPGFLAEGRADKAQRWLGFVQGVLWSLGDYSLDELKEHSRTGRVL